jgi:hypothetical protein
MSIIQFRLRSLETEATGRPVSLVVIAEPACGPVTRGGKVITPLYYEVTNSQEIRIASLKPGLGYLCQGARAASGKSETKCECQNLRP